MQTHLYSCHRIHSNSRCTLVKLKLSGTCCNKYVAAFQLFLIIFRIISQPLWNHVGFHTALWSLVKAVSIMAIAVQDGRQSTFLAALDSTCSLLLYCIKCFNNSQQEVFAGRFRRIKRRWGALMSATRVPVRWLLDQTSPSTKCCSEKDDRLRSLHMLLSYH